LRRLFLFDSVNVKKHILFRCNPDYSQVAKEIKADSRWDKWVGKTQE